MEAGGRFTPRARDGMVSGDAEHTSHSPLVPTRTIVLEMNGLRELRHRVGLLQEEFAALLGVPLETFRTCDRRDHRGLDGRMVGDRTDRDLAWTLT